jgi:hypothetical protein
VIEIESSLIGVRPVGLKITRVPRTIVEGSLKGGGSEIERMIARGGRDEGRVREVEQDSELLRLVAG